MQKTSLIVYDANLDPATVFPIQVPLDVSDYDRIRVWGFMVNVSGSLDGLYTDGSFVLRAEDGGPKHLVSAGQPGSVEIDTRTLMTLNGLLFMRPVEDLVWASFGAYGYAA